MSGPDLSDQDGCGRGRAGVSGGLVELDVFDFTEGTRGMREKADATTLVGDRTSCSSPIPSEM